VLLLVGVALWPPGVTTILVVLVLTGWMGVARLVRAEVRTVRERPYVPAAQALGASQCAVLARTCCRTPSARAGRDDARRRQCDPARERTVVPRTRHPAAGAELGQHDRGGRDLLVVAPWVSLAPGSRSS
jgi:peptide/nickel transport system permease protein